MSLGLYQGNYNTKCVSVNGCVNGMSIWAFQEMGREMRKKEWEKIESKIDSNKR